MTQLTVEDKELIQRIHLLLVMYNAFQPGVFALSGWDMVGALTVPHDEVAHLMTDGDTRWIVRGAYDLTDAAPSVHTSPEGLPKARSLYGSLCEQLEHPDSFASQLKHLLNVRQAYGIAASRQILIPDVVSPGLLVMVHELPDARGIQVTALNFGATAIHEVVNLPGVHPGAVVDMINETVVGDLEENGDLQISLGAYRGRSLRIVATIPHL